MLLVTGSGWEVVAFVMCPATGCKGARLNTFCSVYSELYATGEFESMSQQTDEAEHSIEMQLPYIAKVMERYGVFSVCVHMSACIIYTRRVPV